MGRTLVNLKKAKKVLEKFFTDYDLDVEYVLSDEKLSAKSANVSAKPYDDDIYLGIHVYSSGITTFNFIFDYLQKTSQALDLVNDFNEHVFALKASISEDGGLTICHEAEVVDENILDVVASRVLNNVIDDDTVKYLLPLTKLTAPKD